MTRSTFLAAMGASLIACLFTSSLLGVLYFAFGRRVSDSGVFGPPSSSSRARSGPRKFPGRFAGTSIGARGAIGDRRARMAETATGQTTPASELSGSAPADSAIGGKAIAARASIAGGEPDGDGESKRGEKSSAKTPEEGEPSAAIQTLLRGEPLSREAMTEAILTAIEGEDLATIQGLLISELTEKGTLFSPEELPTLFDVLLGVDDYGLQKLALTHLDRVDGGPEAMADGYLDYLANAEKPRHADEILERLVKIGDDAAGTVSALADILRGSTSDSLRGQLARALGEMGDSRAVPALRDALAKAENPYQTKPYLEALAQIGGTEAVSLLVDVASRGDTYALRALRGIEDPEASVILSGSLDPRSDAGYQKELVRKLASLRDVRTLPDLARYLDRSGSSFQRDAISALGNFQDARAAEVLESFARLHEGSKEASYARKYAARVLRNVEREAGRTEPSRSRGRSREGSPQKESKPRRKESRRAA